MPRATYYNSFVQAIRQTVYGRDNRKPIADCLEMIQSELNAANRIYGPQLAACIDGMQEKIDDLDISPYYAFSGGSTELISGDDYILNL